MFFDGDYCAALLTVVSYFYLAIELYKAFWKSPKVDQKITHLYHENPIVGL